LDETEDLINLVGNYISILILVVFRILLLPSLCLWKVFLILLLPILMTETGYFYPLFFISRQKLPRRQRRVLNYYTWIWIRQNIACRVWQYGLILVLCQLDVIRVDGRIFGKSSLSDASCRVSRHQRVFLSAVKLVYAVWGEAKRGEGGLRGRWIKIWCRWGKGNKCDKLHVRRKNYVRVDGVLGWLVLHEALFDYQIKCYNILVEISNVASPLPKIPSQALFSYFVIYFHWGAGFLLFKVDFW